MGLAGKALGQGAGTGDGLTAAHEFEGVLEVALLAELPLDQACQGWPLLKGIEGGGSEIAGGQITGGGLAELLVAAGEIEDVVHHLEGQPELTTEVVKRHQPLFAEPRENTGGPGAVGDQGGGLAVTLFEIGLETLTGVVAIEALSHLAIGEIHDHAGEELHHLQVIEVGEVPAGLGKEEVTGQHSHPMVEAAVHGGHAAARSGLIHHVVVHERGGMDHLGDLRQAPMAGAEGAIGSDGSRNQQHDAGTEPFATGGEEMLGCRLEDRVAGADHGPQIRKQGIEVGLDRLKQLCNGRHGTSCMAEILGGSTHPTRAGDWRLTPCTDGCCPSQAVAALAKATADPVTQ